jgi:hypothetical protein
MWRRLATIGGGLLVLLSVYFIAQRLWVERARLADWEPDAFTLYLLGAGILVYALAGLFPSGNWERLLRLFGLSGEDSIKLRSIYARSQIAKYVPGNVLHIAGRHVMGRALGISHATLSMAAIYEIIGLLAAALSLGLLGAGLLGMEQGLLGDLQTGLLLLLLVAVIFFAGHRFIPKLLGRYGARLHITGHHPTLRLLLIYLGYLGFFLLAGSILLALVNNFSGISDIPSAALVLVIFSLSWTAGFLTPGAPSGIGIREAIIVLMLEGITPSAQALIIAILFRVVTVLGDLLFLLAVMAESRLRYR